MREWEKERERGIKNAFKAVKRVRVWKREREKERKRKDYSKMFKNV